MEGDSILELYLKVHKELVRNLQELAEPYDFNRGELPVLVRLIKGGDGISQKEIRKNVLISKSTLSKTIKNLTEKEYLKKERDTEDRRTTLIYLAERGQEAEKIVRRIDKKAEERMLENFGEEERNRLAMYLERMLEELKG